MSTYTAPLKDMRFVHERAGRPRARSRSCPGFEEATPDTVEAVLEEAREVRAGVLDSAEPSTATRKARHGRDGEVAHAQGFKDAYRQFGEGGWNALQHSSRVRRPGPAEAGRRRRCSEMWNSANMSFSLCPLLTAGRDRGAARCAARDELKQTYLPKMVAGEWTGTMNLTEPQAGSDLALVRTRAEPQGDGTTRSSAQKIFITYGEHDMAENIVHLVLARTPDAPEGVKGISLFVVPKFLVNADGSLGERNDVHCVSHRAQARHPRQPDRGAAYGDKAARRLPGRRGEPRPRVHVHHDERGALRASASGHGDRRARLPARARVSRRSACRGATSADGGERRCRSSTTPTCGAC